MFHDTDITIKTIAPRNTDTGVRVSVLTGVPPPHPGRGDYLVKLPSSKAHTVWRDILPNPPTKCSECGLSMLKVTKNYDNLNEAGIPIPSYLVHCLHCNHKWEVIGEVVADA